MASSLDISTRITRGTKLNVRRAPARSRACLVQYSGDALGRRYLLDAPEITVGRSSVNSVVIHDDSVSRQHAKIISRANVVAIEDMGSSNGTFIHEEPVLSRTTLNDGDILRLGNILFKFFAHDNIENVFHDNIYRMATIDAGTELFNKKYLLETLESEFRFCRIYGRPLSVIYYDLDYFKKVNDEHGHSCGDFILRECSQIAKSCMRGEDVLARYGGEEFVAILPQRRWSHRCRSCRTHTQIDRGTRVCVREPDSETNNLGRRYRESSRVQVRRRIAQRRRPQAVSVQKRRTQPRHVCSSPAFRVAPAPTRQAV